MWASTRSFAASALAALSMVAAPMADGRAVRAPGLPTEVARIAPGVALRGGGDFRWFGFHVYDGFLWAAPGDDPRDGTFVLDLHYRRSLDGEKIAERSAHEIEKLGYGTPSERERWSRFMLGLFPDVRDGDRLTGVHLPGRGVRFFHNGRPIGETDDPAFARAFFAIWLDPRTSQPAFRRTLLGQGRD